MYVLLLICGYKGKGGAGIRGGGVGIRGGGAGIKGREEFSSKNIL